jgi:pimeloyl-ACP methyl ester carboxylesterase
MELLEEKKSGYWPIFNVEHVLEILHYNNVKSWWDELKNVQCPTLVIKGELSEQMSPKERGKMAKILPQGQFVEISGAYHVMHDDQPEIFRDIVESFLTQILEKR